MGVFCGSQPEQIADSVCARPYLPIPAPTTTRAPHRAPHHGDPPTDPLWPTGQRLDGSGKHRGGGGRGVEVVSS